MKRISTVLTALCLVASGCSEGAQKEAAQANSALAVPAQANSADTEGPTVSDFQAPALSGLVVRDHPKGAQIVTPPDGEADQPQAQSGWVAVNIASVEDTGEMVLGSGYPKGGVISKINSIPVRDAAHFRELANSAAGRGEQLDLRVSMFPREMTNESVAF